MGKISKIMSQKILDEGTLISAEKVDDKICLKYNYEGQIYVLWGQCSYRTPTYFKGEEFLEIKKPTPKLLIKLKDKNERKK